MIMAMLLRKYWKNKIIALDEEWQRFKVSLDKVCRPNNVPPKNKLNSLLDQVSESRIKSEKHSQGKSEITYLYDKLTGSNK